MRTTSYFDLLAHTCALAGLSAPEGEDLQDATARQLHRFIQRRLRLVWEMAWWPETMRSQERFYRADYAAGTAYTTGQEVYYPTTELYYVALQSTTGNAPTNATYWAAVGDTFDPYISLDQAGEDPIGKVRLVSEDDPLEEPSPRRVPWEPGANGIEILGTTVPASVYVWFQTPPPALTGADFVASATYAVGDTIYYESDTEGFEGDYYTCLAATTAGQDPEDTPAKWEKQEIPLVMRDAVAHYAAADYLRTGPNRAEAYAEEQAADFTLARALASSATTTTHAPRFRAA